jgi:hypothetical protein
MSRLQSMWVKHRAMVVWTMLCLGAGSLAQAAQTGGLL